MSAAKMRMLAAFISDALERYDPVEISEFVIRDSFDESAIGRTLAQFEEEDYQSWLTSHGWAEIVDKRTGHRAITRATKIIDEKVGPNSDAPSLDKVGV
jgi:hypothetical protein